MPAATIWKGVLHFDDVRVPVRLYSAVQDRNIHFHLLHDQDMVRVKQRLVNARTGKTVPLEQTRRAVPVERDVFVALSDKERESLVPPPSRTIEITSFVKPELIAHEWYDRPYYLGPDGDSEDYFALASAMADRNVQGVARWVMRKKRYVGTLVTDGYLTLYTLKAPGEVIHHQDLDAPEGRALESAEVKMARQLLTALQGDFNPADYHDEYQEKLAELIQAKAQGETIEAETDEEKPTRGSLSELLRASLAETRS